MVGIPGKSKGCITCKRRKVGCDLARPACNRCLKSKRICEGYESYAVFINRGQSGIQKRRRLEEARSSLAPSASLSFQTSHDHQIIAIFWDSHVTSGMTVREKPTWLQFAIQMTSSTIVQQALLALAYTRVGRYRDDSPCVVHGQRYYGSSLALMQQALYDPVLARSNEILAAARCMCLYEAFESTTDTMAAWINQVRGMERIMQLRSPRDFNQPFARAILESMRQNSMIVAVVTRSKSFLSEEDWRTLPWLGTTKNLEQQLYDHGFIVAELFSAVDGDLSTQQYTEIFTQIARSFDALGKINDAIIRCRHDSSVEPSPVLPISVAGMDLTYALLASSLLSKCPASVLQTGKAIIETFIGYTPHSRRKELARQILRHVALCFEKEPKYIVAQLLFALNPARFELRDSGDDETEMRALMDAIESRNAHRLVGGLKKAGTSILPSIIRVHHQTSILQTV